MQRDIGLRMALTFVACSAGLARAQTTRLVGPVGGTECGGFGCDFNTIQAAINAASPSDKITVYRNLGSVSTSDTYDEHLCINKANLTLEGDTSGVRPTIAPSTSPPNDPPVGGSCLGFSAIVTIDAPGVTLLNLEISGKANNGAGGRNPPGTGGRDGERGVHITPRSLSDFP